MIIAKRLYKTLVRLVIFIGIFAPIIGCQTPKQHEIPEEVNFDGEIENYELTR